MFLYLPEWKDIPILTWPVAFVVLGFVGKGLVYLWKGAREAWGNHKLAQGVKRKQLEDAIRGATEQSVANAREWEKAAQALQLQLLVKERQLADKESLIIELEKNSKAVAEFNLTLQGDLAKALRRQDAIEEGNEHLRQRNIELEDKLVKELRQSSDDAYRPKQPRSKS